MNPWEKYKPVESGPWAKYEQPATESGNAPLINIPGQAGAIAGVGEAALNMGTSMYAKAAGDVAGLIDVGKNILTGNMGGDPETLRQEVQEQRTYEPQTQMGQDIVESPYNPINIVGKGLNWVADKVSGFGEGSDTALGAISNLIHETVMQSPVLIGGKLSGKTRLADQQAKLNVLKGQNKLIDAARTEAQNVGFITPAEKGVKAQVSGLAKTNKSISQKNQTVATEIAKKDIGVPVDEAISQPVLKTLKEQHYKAYENVVKEATNNTSGSIYPPGAKLRVVPTPEFNTKIQGYLDDIDTSLKEYPMSNKALIPAKKLFDEQLRKLSHDPQAIMDNIRQMRSEANLLYKKSDSRPTDIATASAKLSIAMALEDLLDQHLVTLGKPDAVLKFREARTQLAKIHNVEMATNPQTGLVDIQTLSRLAKKQKLTGGLKTVADFGTAFETASRSVHGAPEMIGLFDAVVAGTSFVAGHPQWAALEFLGRLGIPGLARTGALQNKTPTYKATGYPKTVGVGAAAQNYQMTDQDREISELINR